MDPRLLEGIDWDQIYQAIYFIAIFSLAGVVFLGSLLLAQGVAPSLLTTGHLPRGVARWRFFLYPLALIALATSVSALLRAAGLIRDILDFYPRFWQ